MCACSYPKGQHHVAFAVVGHPVSLHPLILSRLDDCSIGDVGKTSLANTLQSPGNTTLLDLEYESLACFLTLANTYKRLTFLTYRGSLGRNRVGPRGDTDLVLMLRSNITLQILT